jgi:8-oxo-dGTP pyrophosphatase MutT (NUDIX family)
MSVPLQQIRERLARQTHHEVDPSRVRRRAAVAAILREEQPDRGTEVLLIRRAEHPADPWSGHMAFPGGRFEPGHDASLLDTAVRETREEVGLDLIGRADLLGRLDEVEAVARGGRPVGLAIAPYVFHLPGGPPSLVPDPTEVAETVWAPLGPLRDGAADTIYPFQHEGQVHPFPAWDVEGRIVWGLTYRMLRTLLDRLG